MEFVIVLEGQIFLNFPRDLIVWIIKDSEMVSR